MCPARVNIGRVRAARDTSTDFVGAAIDGNLPRGATSVLDPRVHDPVVESEVPVSFDHGPEHRLVARLSTHGPATKSN